MSKVKVRVVLVEYYRREHNRAGVCSAGGGEVAEQHEQHLVRGLKVRVRVRDRDSEDRVGVRVGVGVRVRVRVTVTVMVRVRVRVRVRISTSSTSEKTSSMKAAVHARRGPNV